MNLTSKSTMKGLAFTLVLAMLLTMVPMLPGIGQVDEVYAGVSVPSVLTTDSSVIYANGHPIILTQGAFSTSTCIYLDNGELGVFELGTDVLVELASLMGTSAGGYNLSDYTIYGGAKSAEVTSTSITMTGGTVNYIYGGGENSDATVSGSAIVTISGGTVNQNVYGGGSYGKVLSGTAVTMTGGRVDCIYGGGDMGDVSGSATVNISGGTVNQSVYGGGQRSNVLGNTAVTISGGNVINVVYGGGQGVGGSGGNVEGGTAVTISGGTVGNVYGGGQGVEGSGGNVEGDTAVTISGGTVKGKVSGGGNVAVSGTTSVAIKGGSIMGPVSPQPTNGSSVPGENVYKATLTLKDENGSSLYEIAVTNIVNAESYGLTGVHTSNEGKIGVYLASGTSISTVKSNSITYKVSGAAVVVTSDGAAAGDFYAQAAQTPTSRGGGGSSTATSNIIKTDDTKKAESANEGTVKFSPANPSKGTKVIITVDESVSYEAGTPVVKDADGNLIPVTDNGDGTFSIIMPDTPITVDTPFEPIFGEEKETPPFTQSVKSKQKINLNGKDISLGTYNVDGYNFTKLRDLAAVLNETGSKFGIETGEGRSIILSPGQSYNPVGGELEFGDDMSGTCVVSQWTVTINGVVRYLDVYNIGGNNYFKLRDLGQLLDFDVDYDKDTNTALITAK